MALQLRPPRSPKRLTAQVPRLLKEACGGSLHPLKPSEAAAISNSLSYRRNTRNSLPESLLAAGEARGMLRHTLRGHTARRLVIRPMEELIYRPQRLGVCETSSRPR